MRASSNIKKFLSMRKTQPKFFKSISIHLLCILALYIFGIAAIGYALKDSGISPKYSGNWFVVILSSFVLVSVQFLHTLPAWWRVFKREWYFAYTLSLKEDYQENNRTK